MNDPDVIRLYLERSEEAVSLSEERYGNYLRAIAGRILPDPRDAEEAVQDAFLACWNSIPPKRPDDFSAYAGRLCRNASIDRARRNSREKRGGGEYEAVLEEVASISSGDTPESELEAAAFRKTLNGFLHGLPKRKRRVFVQRYWYLLPIKQIASDNGMSEAAVKMQLSRTRAELKELLIKEGVFYE